MTECESSSNALCELLNRRDGRLVVVREPKLRKCIHMAQMFLHRYAGSANTTVMQEAIVGKLRRDVERRITALHKKSDVVKTEIGTSDVVRRFPVIGSVLCNIAEESPECAHEILSILS